MLCSNWTVMAAGSCAASSLLLFWGACMQQDMASRITRHSCKCRAARTRSVCEDVSGIAMLCAYSSKQPNFSLLLVRLMPGMYSCMLTSQVIVRHNAPGDLGASGKGCAPAALGRAQTSASLYSFPAAKAPGLGAGLASPACQPARGVALAR